MPDSFGARLRKRREERQIDLAAIAASTKISVALLQGLERDDVSRWPSGIFRRAFIRAYANAIGLDADAIVRDFLERYPDPAEVVAVPAGGVAIPIREVADVPPTGVGRLVDSAARGLDRLRGLRQRSSTDPPLAPAPPASVDQPAADPPPSPPEWTPDLAAVARICTEFGRVADESTLRALVAQAADAIGAEGAILWLCDSATTQLRPALAHGYADAVVAQLPRVNCDDANATAAAFRAAEPRIVNGTNTAHGALAVPLITSAGCAGVLAMEFGHCREQHPIVRAVAAIFAAQLASLFPAAIPPAAERRQA
jgi:transcriptional regulator with XRE-family HTH domain